MIQQITARELCTDAMRLAGYLAAKATPKYEDMAIAMTELRGLIDIWHSERLMDLYDEDVAFTSSSSSFTIGPTGDCVVSDIPVSINSIRAIVSGQEIALQQIRYSDAGSNGITSESASYPCKYSYQPKLENGTITLFPAPIGGLSLKIGIGNRIAPPEDENTVMTLRSGWYQTIRYCLADNLMIPLEIPQGNLSESITQKATSYKNRLKATNLRVPARIVKLDCCFGRSGRR